jgi:membrane protein implicated in regulation of membrane protease activity
LQAADLRQNVGKVIQEETRMTEANVWWVLVGLAVVVELFTGSFYLLMVAFGLAGAAGAASLGAGMTAQLIVAAVVGGGLVGLLTYLRRKRVDSPSARSMRSVNLDVGETVQVAHWNPDGTADVRYRGANWTAVAHNQDQPSPGPHRVTELVGSRLVLEKI